MSKKFKVGDRVVDSGGWKGTIESIVPYQGVWYYLVYGNCVGVWYKARELSLVDRNGESQSKCSYGKLMV